MQLRKVTAITLNSRRHDDISQTLCWPAQTFVYAWRSLTATSPDQLTFIVYEASWSELVHLGKVSGKCKYFKSCSFGPETEFTPLILCLKMGIFLRFPPHCKIPKILNPFNRSLHPSLPHPTPAKIPEIRTPFYRRLHPPPPTPPPLKCLKFAPPFTKVCTPPPPPPHPR